MVNKTGNVGPAQFRQGGGLSAADLNRIVDGLARRIIGDGQSVQVRSFNGQVVISAKQAPRAAAGGAMVLAEITGKVGGSKYKCKVLDSDLSEIENMKSIEVVHIQAAGNETMPSGTKIIAHKVYGKWYMAGNVWL